MYTWHLSNSILLGFDKYTTALFLNSRRRSPSGFMNKIVVSFAEYNIYFYQDMDLKFEELVILT
jgi:hypothetical protein